MVEWCTISDQSEEGDTREAVHYGTVRGVWIVMVEVIALTQEGTPLGDIVATRESGSCVR